MSEVTTINAVARERAGKGEARATRRQGLVPGVIYGNKQPSVLIAVTPRLLHVELSKAGFYTRLFDVQIEGGKSEHCLARDIQRHPVTGQALHIDFLRVSDEAKVHVRVPVHFANVEKSAGIKRGGVLNVVAHDLEIIVPAGNIPKELIIDLSEANIGDSFHIEQVQLPAGATHAAHEKGFTVATIAAPTVALAAEGGETA